jgi:hypothetical protein
MAHLTIDELKKIRLSAMTGDERALFDETYDATRLALDRDAPGGTAVREAGRGAPRRPRGPFGRHRAR